MDEGREGFRGKTVSDGATDRGGRAWATRIDI